MTTHHTKAGDTQPALKATLYDARGQPVDLTGATVKIYVNLKGNGILERQAEIVSAEEGKVMYVPEPGDIPSAGTFYAEFRVMFDDGRIETFPNSGYLLISVGQSIGGG